MGKKTVKRIEKVLYKMGKRFVRTVLSGKSFVRSIKELVKNSRDWEGDNIYFYTEDRNTLVIVDDGVGMGKQNREDFFSLAKPTVKEDKRQSRKWDTGAKHILISFCKDCTVRTVPKEESDSAFVFGVTTDEHVINVGSGGTIECEVRDVNKANWPYDFPQGTGTEIRYTFSNPRSKSILRGKALAEELAAILPKKFAEIVKVDGKPLPPKDMIGDDFDVVLEHPQLGPVHIQIYRPAKKRSSERLELAGTEIGEAPLTELNSVLGASLRLDDVFLRPDLAGVICCALFKEYVNEDRHTISSEITDNPRLVHFVNLLNSQAREIERKLKLPVAGGKQAGEDQAIIDGVARRFNIAFAKGQTPPQVIDTGNGTGDPDPTQRGPKGKPAIRLDLPRREYEPGEEISVKVRIRKDIDHNVDEVVWRTESSLAKDVTRTDKGITMVADKVGRGIVSADLPSTPYHKSAAYEVIEKRNLKFSNTIISCLMGERLPIMAVNADKVGEKLYWDWDGDCEVDPQGNRAIFIGLHPGQCTVRAWDTKNPGQKAIMEITVYRDQNLICIDGIWFKYKFFTGASTAADTPVHMVKGGEIHEVHDLFIMEGAPGYDEAKERGELEQFICMAIATRFPAFRHFELEGNSLADMQPSELPDLWKMIEAEIFQIYNLISMGANKKR